MDDNNVISYDVPEEQQCAKCKEYETEVEEYGAALVILAFIGPIIGILIGLFAAKKILGK
ncbi:MAG: hypothetical protein FWE92_00525 [Defluviitaleaceae bacterium]|nr:hypothetical protein [Defluviitaleaceae bacterium]